MEKAMALFADPRFARYLKYLFYLALILTLVADFFVERKAVYFPWDVIPGLYAVFGFAGCYLIIKFAKALGYHWLMKEEDYYD
jgi:uncharacterized membrane protein YkvA (DUF1232 family)